LHIKNGDGRNHLVSNAIIKIDGKQVFGPSDFSKKVIELTKKIKGLSNNSKLEVEIRSAPGSYLEIWIEGKLKPNSGTVKDIDGNVYHTVTIGTQVWMVEDLKVTHYRNGDPIQYAPDDLQWMLTIAGAYCWYHNDLSNKTKLGAMYNWFAVIDSRKLTPPGWHVPSDDEWIILEDYLGGREVAGGKLKATGTLEDGKGLWAFPNLGATNESGFTALPGGYRNSIGRFSIQASIEYPHPEGLLGSSWTSTFTVEGGYIRPVMRLFYWNSEQVNLNQHVSRTYGSYVRCIKD